jgi:hypothetical protein
MNIIQVDFPFNQYIREEHPKSQVYLHHTAGGPNGVGTFGWWASNKERVATCVSISGIGKGCVDGQIVQGFSSKFWAYHLGLKKSVFSSRKIPYTQLDKISIGIEICNWGNLRETNGKFYNYVGREMTNGIIKLDKPYKGFTYFHDYTDAQIESVQQLLLLWNKRYGIPLDYNEDIWDISSRALKGEPGIYTHNSVIKGKIDIYPHPRMIEMLKSLK